MKPILYAFLILALLEFAGPVRAEAVPVNASSVAGNKLKTDVILLAVPVAVKSSSAVRVVDALEKSPEEMGANWKIVVFRIERVIKGSFKTISVKDPSLWNQVKGAADDKNVLKLITMDFERPEDASYEKDTLSLAVTDPMRLFGIDEDSISSKQRFRINLALVQKEPKNYILVKSEKA